MKTFLFKKLLLNSGWLTDVYVAVSDEGKISSISAEKPNTSFETINGVAIPTFYNAHSHAFQYAMAGLAETHDTTKATADDFWSWREAMYNLALSISPDDLEAIATKLYSEMVRHGYSQVAEFHYVHHDKNGKPYSNLAEMGERLISAAKTAGIRITLIPIFYQKGGFGKAPTEKQRRFISPTVEDYFKLYDASKRACGHYEFANISIGIHSLRGVEPADVVKVAEQGDNNVPFHIHISEQLKEIEDSLAYLGKRPVEWLSENVALNNRFQLVHATHLTDFEVESIAKYGAQVVLCPSTEGNLGDGIFPLQKFQVLGGKWTIGTDSHVGLNPLEELRILDYGQRLISHKRNIFVSKKEGNSGKYALEQSVVGGRIAGNNYNAKYFEVGQPLDALVLDFDQPLLSTTSDEHLLNTIVYSSDSSWNLGTLINGKWTVKNNKHLQQETINEQFTKTILDLKSR